jgi:hypothetical protein
MNELRDLFCALALYAQHHAPCAAHTVNGAPCTCGLRQRLNELSVALYAPPTDHPKEAACATC